MIIYYLLVPACAYMHSFHRDNVNLEFPRTLGLWVIYHSGCYRSFSIIPISVSCILLHLSQDTILDLLIRLPVKAVYAPGRTESVSTVGTHCSTGEEEEMKRLEPGNRQIDVGKRGRRRGVGEKMCPW